MDLSIIIVNYNTEVLLKQCLESIFNTTIDITYEVWVVDNKSTDGSVEMCEREFPQVNLIKNSINGGFSQANNLAIKQCDNSRYILFLNPDTIVFKDTLKECVKILDSRSEIGCIGCKVVKENGELDKACKRGFPTPWNSLCYFLKLDKAFPNKEKFGGYNATFIDEDKESEIDCLVGAFMMFPKLVTEKIGHLDESFFMYGEDIDWCYRIKEAGFINYYYPKVKITHFKGESSKKQSYKMIRVFHESMIIFYDKHYKKKYNVGINMMVKFSIKLKMYLSLIINSFRKEKKVS